MAALDITPVAAAAWVAPITPSAVAVPYPTNQAGDRIYLIIHAKQTTAAGSTIATPAGWTLIDQRMVGNTGVAPGNGSGATRIATFARTVSTPLTGDATATVLNGNSTAACLHVYRPDGTGVTWSESTVAGGTGGTASTSLSVATSPSIALAVKDKLLAIIGSADDTADPFTLTAINQTGSTIATPTKFPDPGYGTAVGNDSAGCSFYSTVTAGGATAVASTVGSQNTAETAGIVLIRVRADGTPPSENYSGSLDLSGAGTMTRAGTPAIPGSLGLSGSGTVALPGSPAITGPLALSGSGTLGLSGFASVAHSGSIGLSGSGTLTTIGTPSVQSALNLSGSGTLTTIGSPAFTRPLALSGSGTLSTIGAPGGIGSVALSGSGTLGITGTPAPRGTLGLSGEGTLGMSGFASVHFEGSLSLSGSGTLLPAQTGLTTIGTLPLSGSGTLGRAGSPSVAASIALSGAGTLSRAGSPGVAGSVALSGSGALGATGVPRPTGALPLSGVGGLVPAQHRITVISTLGLSGNGTLLVGSFIIGVLNLSGSGTLTAGSTAMSARGAVALAGSGTLTTIGGPHVVGAVSLSGEGALNLLGALGAVGHLALSGDGTLTRSGVLAVNGYLALAGEGLLTMDTGVTPALADIEAVISTPHFRAILEEDDTAATILTHLVRASLPYGGPVRSGP